MDEQRPSEVIENFLSYIDSVKTEYETNFAIVGEEDKRLQDLLHALEFAPNKQERNKIATQFQRSRKRRRKAKDRVLELEKLYDFQKDQANRPFLKRLRGILQPQKGTEKYLESEREYKKRVGDNDADDIGGQQTAGKKA